MEAEVKAGSQLAVRRELAITCQSVGSFKLTLSVGAAPVLPVGAVDSKLEDNGREVTVLVHCGALRVFESPNPSPSGRFGRFGLAGRITPDAKVDLALAAPGEDVGPNAGQGRAYAFDASGELLFALDLPQPQAGAAFGSAVAVGDVNGDGRADIALGAPLEDVLGKADAGRTYVFSGLDGKLLRTLTAPNLQAGARFGASVALGDVNGDGKADVAAGAPFQDVGANADQGQVYVLDGATGNLIRTLNSANPEPGGQFGGDVGPSEITPDGKRDLVVGAPAEDVLLGATLLMDAGHVYAFDGASGNLIPNLGWMTSPNPQAFARYGSAVAISDDLTGDGFGEIYAGAPLEDVGGNADQGRAYLFDGAQGGLIRTLNSTNGEAGGGFGAAIADREFITPDGKHDVVVGAPFEDVSGFVDAGRAYAFDGASGALIGGTPYGSPDPSPGRIRFGSAVAMADMTGEGRGEVVAAAPFADTNPADAGSVYAFCAVPWTVPSGDTDCDGFSLSLEDHAGTNPEASCGFNANPADFNNDGFFTGADLSAIAADIGRTVPPAPVRKDIAPEPAGDNAVTGADLSRVAGVIGLAC